MAFRVIMKIVFHTIIFLSSLVCNAQHSFFDQSNLFFQTYVNGGLVDYQKIKANPKLINSLINQIAYFQIKDKSPEEQKAFYTNAYNLLVIKQVVDNYPISSPWDVPGFFSEQEFNVTGQIVTLDQLEKEILFSAFPDPRLHFVLVCAAIGCPPIANYAYSPDSLEYTLERKTMEVLNIDWYVRVSKNNVAVSKVFEWYNSDFESDTTSRLEYINLYRHIKIPETHSIDTYEYNWELNDTKNSFRY